MRAEEIERIAGIFKALSDPTRLKLIRLLGSQTAVSCAGREGCSRFLCVGALAHKLGVTQSAVSQHLRVLKQAGLVRGERRASFMHYSIDKVGLRKYGAALRTVLGGDVL